MHKRWRWLLQGAFGLPVVVLTDVVYSKLPSSVAKHIPMFLTSLLFYFVWDRVAAAVRDIKATEESKQQAADEAAEALCGYAKVDNYELPLPHDPRWKSDQDIYGRHLYRIGDAVAVNRKDSELYVNLIPIQSTTRTLRYADRVIVACNQRELDGVIKSKHTQ